MKPTAQLILLSFLLFAPQGLAKVQDSLLESYYEVFKKGPRLKECAIDKIYGMDYRRNDKDAKHLKGLVEGAHFTVGVQRGLYGNTGSIESDLDYVLRKFPNHYKALMVMANHQDSGRFEARRRKERADRLWPSTECYFFKALQLTPNDTLVHSVIAVYYHKKKNYEVAQRHYAYSIELNPQNAEAQYNYGLLLLDLNQPVLALEQAKIAMQLGHPLEGLKNKLEEAGIWK